MNGTDVDNKPEIVVVDLNHPVAGEDVVVEGEVVENRPATAEEIQEVITMMSGGGGCGCDSCGCEDDDCGDGGCGSGCGCH